MAVESRATLREGLLRYFTDNGFPAEGGYDEKWALVRIGPIPLGIPNTRARRRAVRFHDLNHVVAGYGTDLRGEAEISAWELGSGCGTYWAGWVLDLGGILVGVVRWPRRTFAAFVRGRRTRNLYGQNYEELLAQPLDDVRRSLGLETDRSDAPPSAGDTALFAALLAVAPVASAVPFWTSILFSPLWLSSGIHRQRRAMPVES